MHPNPYVVEDLARQREAEMQRMVKYAWLWPPRRRRALGERVWSLLVLCVVMSCGLLWLLP